MHKNRVCVEEEREVRVEEKFYLFNSVQSLSHVQLFTTPWTAARQASLFIINFWSLLKLISIALVMLSNHLILCHPLLLPPSISVNFLPVSDQGMTVLPSLKRNQG